ncbi:ABC transporter family substrate-binding protein [Solwaraspora sp. WMMD1047]|uniref:ABC transporter family substrate-binding protein n=1 Tax=Solwaraspora sp. WMMD1047 TaxID=3016102 RepID=UPI002415A7B5|nr:ABC transporter family substrate-binding protein [Solwaraspora sp. WMMD1047]MDG4830942.1 ABC transporter family substrate-binding protein [Solwaraspora sp. WMMD1047]
MFTRHRRAAGLTSLAVTAVLITTACTSDGGNSEAEGQAGLAGCAERPLDCNSGETRQGGQIVWYMEQDIATWNVNSDDGGHFSTTQMLNGLIPGAYYAAPDLLPHWNTDLLVEEPTITVESPQTVVYKIRPEAVWSDGTPISAEDFIYQFKTRNTRDCPDCATASSSGYDVLASVVGSDDGKTVTATYQDGVKFPDWRQVFGEIYPAHIAKANGGTDTPEQLAASWQYFKTTQPTWSGGPYVIESYVEGQQLIQIPNDKWYGKVKPPLEKFIFKITTDQSSFVPALQNDELQGGYPLPNQDMVSQVSQLPGYHTYIGHGLNWEHFDLNLQNKFLKDKALREAVFKAIDVPGIIARTVGQYDPKAEPLGSHNYFPGSPYYQDVVTPTGAGSGDVEAAKQVLTAAGYTDVGTALKTPAGEPVTLRIRHTAGNQSRATTSELAQASLRELGIDATIETTEDLSGTLANGDFDLIVFAWIGTPFAFQGAQQLWGLGSGSNFGKWENPAANDLINQAASQLDEAKGAELLNQANALMAADYYVLPLYQRPTYLVVKSDYVNVRDNATSAGPTYNLQEWGLKATAE